MQIKFEIEDLRRVVYWASCKFRSDKSARIMGQAEKRDLLGGFLDRWINRAPEFIIFRHLLKAKNYEALPDFYFYDEKSKKNAPDVLGIRKRNGEIVKFVEYVDGSWVQLPKTPWIEVKTSRSDQALNAIGESQFQDDRYFVIVESYIKKDYLISIIDKSVFSDEVFESFRSPAGDFVRSDRLDSIVVPEKVTPDSSLGYFRLVGIFKGSELKKISRLCRGKSKDIPAESPLYISSYERIEAIDRPEIGKLVEGIHSLKITYCYKKIEKEVFAVPIAISFLSPCSEAKIVKMTKSYIIIALVGKMQIDNKILTEGFYKILFKQFGRTSTSNEYIFSKNILESKAKECKEELIAELDSYGI